MNVLPNLNKAVKPSGIIQHVNNDTRIRWISKDAIEVGKYYYVFLRTVGREYEPGLPEEQERGIWLLGKVRGVYDTSPTWPYPRTYKIDFTHALMSEPGIPPEYDDLEGAGDGRTIAYSHIQSPSEAGLLPPERTVARFYIPEQMGGRRLRRRYTGRRRQQKKRTIRRRI